MEVPVIHTSNQEKSISVYIVTHKDSPKLIDDACYKQVFVGPYGRKAYEEGHLAADAVYDGCGENIAFKNSSYCELTALYWLWKNDKSDYQGLCHYRRYFGTGLGHLLKVLTGANCLFLHGDQMCGIFDKGYDAIVVRRKKHPRGMTVKESYASKHHVEDLDACRDYIARACPEWLVPFDTAMDRHWTYAFNMIVSRRELMDECCSFMFNVLDGVEDEIDARLPCYDEYNKRVYGFLGERLMHAFIESLLAHGGKIKEQPVICTEDPDAIRWALQNLSRGGV